MPPPHGREHADILAQFVHKAGAPALHGAVLLALPEGHTPPVQVRLNVRVPFPQVVLQSPSVQADQMPHAGALQVVVCTSGPLQDPVQPSQRRL